MGPALFQTYLFQYVGDRIAYGRSRSQRQIYDAERYVQLFRRFASDQLSHSCYLESSLFYQVGHLRQGSLLRHFRQGGSDYARSGDPYIYYAIRFSDAVECSGHEGIILRRVAEDYQLGSADALSVFGQLSRFSDHIAHHLHGIHVDPGFRRAYVDG